MEKEPELQTLKVFTDFYFNGKKEKIWVEVDFTKYGCWGRTVIEIYDYRFLDEKGEYELDDENYPSVTHKDDLKNWKLLEKAVA